jgi:amidase
VPGSRVNSDPECIKAVELAGTLLADLGHHVQYETVPELDEPTMTDSFRILFSVAIAREVARWESRLGIAIGESNLEARNWATACYGNSMTATRYVAARESLSRYGRRLTQWWSSGHDILVTPTMPQLPPVLGTYDAQRESMSQLGAFTRPFNVTGQPAISVPLHQAANGLPVGVQLAAPYGRDDWLLSVATALEAATGWNTRFPALAMTAG